jgi:hypothetical protein
MESELKIKLRFYYVDGGIHPKIGQVYHWQQEAIGGPDAQRYTQYMAEVLDAVAQTVSSCDRLLGFIDDVEKGRQAEVVAGGNDVTLTMQPSGVQVDIEINDEWVGQPEGRFKLQEWKALLQGWRRFLKLPQSLDTVLEIDV